MAEGFPGAVGCTPLIRLRHLSETTGCEILGKAEFQNPGGSVKDRAALALIEDAERSGALRPGGTIVEGTAGNTGIGLALVGLSRGYRSIFIVPDNFSHEKTDLLKTLGAEVRRVPPKPYKDPDNYQHIARRTAGAIDGGWWANQFDNTANLDGHYRTTGPEIWEQTDGRVTAFVASIGSGGTLAGVSRFLKERSSSVRAVCADPYGAAMWSWFTNGNTDTDDGDSVAEGIGQGRVTKNVAASLVDDAYRIGDPVAVEVLYHLLRREGLYLGLSSAINVAGALRLARERGPGQVIVTVLCDGGARYASKLYNPAWLAEQKLTPVSEGLEFLDRLAEVPPTEAG
ncbi:cysteine synthase [Opitutaceae bacterium TAV5]|nr:cysteine synthase [Opitutaceae bacterium TAV5]